MSWPVYPTYTDVGVSWLDTYPEAWTSTPLKLLAAMQNGDSITSEAIEDSGEYPVYGGNGLRGYTSAYTHQGDRVLIGRQGALCGNIHLVSGRYWASEHAIVTTPGRAVSPRWLAYVLDVMNLGQYSQAAAQPGIAADVIGKLRVPTPSPSEQEGIADFLDYETAKIAALIGKQEQLIATLREDRTATITQAVTKGLDPHVEMKDSGVEWLGDVPAHWDIRQLKWGSPVKRGASPRPIDDPKYFDDEGHWSWVRIADVSASGGHLFETTQRMSELGSALSVKLEPGSLFVSIAGTVGKPCITHIPVCIHDGFVYFPTLDMEKDYLYRIFEAGECYRGLGKLGTQLNLNTDTIGSIQMPFPPRPEQKRIVAELEARCAKLDTLIAKANEMIATLREYRSAFITDAVTGKIDVRAAV